MLGNLISSTVTLQADSAATFAASQKNLSVSDTQATSSEDNPDRTQGMLNEFEQHLERLIEKVHSRVAVQQGNSAHESSEQLNNEQLTEAEAELVLDQVMSYLNEHQELISNDEGLSSVAEILRQQPKTSVLIDSLDQQQRESFVSDVKALYLAGSTPEVSDNDLLMELDSDGEGVIRQPQPLNISVEQDHNARVNAKHEVVITPIEQLKPPQTPLPKADDDMIVVTPIRDDIIVIDPIRDDKAIAKDLLMDIEHANLRATNQVADKDKSSDKVVEKPSMAREFINTSIAPSAVDSDNEIVDKTIPVRQDIVQSPVQVVEKPSMDREFINNLLPPSGSDNEIVEKSIPVRQDIVQSLVQQPNRTTNDKLLTTANEPSDISESDDVVVTKVQPENLPTRNTTALQMAATSTPVPNTMVPNTMVPNTMVPNSTDSNITSIKPTPPPVDVLPAATPVSTISEVEPEMFQPIVADIVQLKSTLKATIMALPAPQQQQLKQQVNNDAQVAPKPITTEQLLEQISHSQLKVLGDKGTESTVSTLGLSVANHVLVKEPLTGSMTKNIGILGEINNSELSGDEVSIDVKLQVSDKNNGAQQGALTFESMIKQLDGQQRLVVTQPNDQLSAANIVNSKTEQHDAQSLNQPTTNASKTLQEQLQQQLQQKIPLHEQFAAANLKERVGLMLNGGISQAVISLDPEELGAMSIRMVMQNDQLSVQFQVQNSAAKEMLDQTMGKLKEMLEEQGIALGQSDVDQESQQEQSAQSSGELAGHELDDFESDVVPETLVLHKQSADGIDYYA